MCAFKSGLFFPTPTAKTRTFDTTSLSNPAHQQRSAITALAQIPYRGHTLSFWLLRFSSGSEELEHTEHVIA